MMKKIFVFAAFVLFVLTACSKNGNGDLAKNPDKKDIAAVKRDLSDIKADGKLRAITGFNATSYFMYNGQLMGYEYELLNKLAAHLGLELEIVLAKNMNEILDMLERGDGDIIAYSVTVTKERSARVNFSDYLFTTKQVLVQKKPDNWREKKVHETEKELIRNQIDLINKNVHVRRNSSYYSRLQNLSDEIGGNIKICEAGGDTTTGELIEEVAKGRIKLTVADENIARNYSGFYSNLDIKTPISFPQRTAWAVRKSSPGLLKEVNAWIRNMKKQSDFYVIYNKYFKSRNEFKKRVSSSYFSKTGGKISQYDGLIKKYAMELNWDWRLLASQIYQESQFDYKAESWAGALGLMQILPKTGKQYGAKNLFDPADNIKTGSMIIKWLFNYWKKIEDPSQRLKFVLGSYNAGIGHINDAIRLSEKYGKRTDEWDNNVAVYVLKLSSPGFYNDDVVKYGYLRGVEPVCYVNEILERHTHFIKFIPDTQPSETVN